MLTTQLQTNIDANATADGIESAAGDVSDQDIQDDVDANQTASELADTNMQADIDGNETDSDNADDSVANEHRCQRNCGRY